MQSRLLSERFNDLNGRDSIGNLNVAFLLALLQFICVYDLLFEVSQGNFLSFDKDATEFTPLGFCELFARLILRHVINFVGHVHDQVNNARCDLNIDLSLRLLSFSVDLFVLGLLRLYLLLSRGFASNCLPLALLFHLLVLLFPLGLDIEGFGAALVGLHLLALAQALVFIGVFLLLLLLLQQLLN